jgi:hypothetical protein
MLSRGKAQNPPLFVSHLNPRNRLLENAATGLNVVASEVVSGEASM